MGMHSYAMSGRRTEAENAGVWLAQKKVFLPVTVYSLFTFA